MPYLKDILVVLQNGGIGLRQPGIVWLHLLQCQRGGVQQVWLIPPSFLLEHRQQFSNVVYHQEYYFTRRGVINGHPEVFMHFAPRDGYFFKSSHITHQYQKESWK